MRRFMSKRSPCPCGCAEIHVTQRVLVYDHESCTYVYIGTENVSAGGSAETLIKQEFLTRVPLSDYIYVFKETRCSY